MLWIALALLALGGGGAFWLSSSSSGGGEEEERGEGRLGWWGLFGGGSSVDGWLLLLAVGALVAGKFDFCWGGRLADGSIVE